MRAWSLLVAFGFAACGHHATDACGIAGWTGDLVGMLAVVVVIIQVGDDEAL
ncbi:MAG TPA: hypothetical protein VF148_08975 [Acidimicrobiia bacterium]